MGMGIELHIILLYALGLILLYSLGWFLLVPFKWILRLIWNSVLGGVMLLLINLAGGGVGIFIAINPITVLVAGFLGVPGVLLLLLLQKIL